MNNKEKDETIQEILDEDKVVAKKKKRGGGCFVRFLLVLTLLFICVYGFILLRQKMLDIEAQAIVAARQTATAQAAAPQAAEPAPAETQPVATAETTMEAAEAEAGTATPEPGVELTATVSALLTEVAEFQASATPAP